MPSYSYWCDRVNEEFEEFHSIMIVLDKCLLCEKAGREQHCPKRLISGGSGRGIVELTGDELVKKTKEDAAKFKKEVYSNEYQYASVIGENRYQEIQKGLDRGKRNR
jgi:hypothetical protein